ncbi:MULTISPECIES: glutamyl-tRNA reductase [unclassified Granulicatella]|uniref:glutamyl-tRNA reductase n=1 Tax=unclassified Granulicatella TaxID=2630493 RepID=UPI0010735987|nr:MULTISPECIES: glutamyl-tRNA reductase [unclassified Granulicatella]MBF0779530.1 glutamyl-tRNA reductase [Granulicatella sp. 19428wC4_WM01]TFU96495.1 glutamyl-tRNA reductase [Granulicatella sp. WM01]
MYLLYVGLTHKQTPIEVREKLHFSSEQLQDALKQLKQEKSILEDIIVSTCNRTELYLVVDQLHTGRYYAKMFLAHFFNVNLSELEPYLVFKTSEAVLEHLFRVSVGLESKVIGETQILGQLKSAFEVAQQEKTIGIILNYVFRQAITFSKAMHEKYRINERPSSVSLIAVQQLEQMNSDYTKQTLAILGMGKMGKLVAKYALDKPFKSIKIVNRTLEKAHEFCVADHICAYPLSELAAVVQQADIVFSALSTESFIVMPKMIKKGAIIFDLGVPRTVHPVEHATIFDIDHLTNTLDQYNDERQHIAQSIEQDIALEIDKFYEWRQQLGIVPLIKELREHALHAQESALSSLLRKIPHLTPKEQKHVQKHMKSIVNQILKEPILQLKEMSVGQTSAYDIALVKKLFGLDKDKEEKDESC